MVAKVLGWVGVGVGGAVALLVVGYASLVVVWVAGTLFLVGPDELSHQLHQREAELHRAAGGVRAWLPTDLTEPMAPPLVHDDGGAIAFAEYWVAVNEHALDSGDPSLLASLSESGCTECDLAVSTVTAVTDRGWAFYESDLRTTGAAVVAGPADGAGGADEGLTTVHLDVEVAPFTLIGVTDDGVPVLQDLAGIDASTDVDLRWVDDRWVVAEITGDRFAPAYE